MTTMALTYLCLGLWLTVGVINGAPADDLDTKIINGRAAKTAEFPFIVSLQWKDYDGKIGRWCGGSILNSKWILTAAHCVDPPLAMDTFYVRAGVTNSWDTESPNGQLVKVKQYYQHPGYHRLHNVNPDDIALLELKTPLKFTQYVQPIPLPKAGYVPTGMSTLIGWGEAGNLTHHYSPDDLQAVDLDIYPLKECKKMFNREVYNEHVCPGYRGKGSCQGDSGGPLIQDINSKRTLIGVSSFVPTPCATAPSVYMNVASYITDFINPKTGLK